jgi:hypothetical protein
MTEELSLTIASDTERNDLFAELWRGDEQWGEIGPGPTEGSFTIEVFAPSAAPSYVFDVAELLSSVERARERLAQMQRPIEDPTPPATADPRAAPVAAP